MIETKNCSKIYRLGEKEIHALNNVSVFIDKGEFVAVVGKSGSGKSTFLNLIGGLDSPTKGKIKINGTDITDMSEKKLGEFRRKNLGFVFQAFNLVPELTLKENILFPALIEKTDIKDSYFDFLVESLGLCDRKEHLPSQLSGGEQQRAAIARALILSPPVLLLDEPTGNLDEATSEKTLELLAALKKEIGFTTVLVTHDPDVAARADRKIILRDGCVQ